MIDLHIHTKNSSGTDEIEDILNKAEKLKLSAISITDNENVKVYEDLKNPRIRNLYSGNIITGTEIKTIFDNVVIDILAYDFDYDKLKDSSIVDSERIRLAQYEYLENYIKIGKKLGLKFNEDIKIKTYASQDFYDEVIKYKENFEILPELKEKNEKFFKVTQRNKKSPFYIDESIDIFNINYIINEIHKCGGKIFLAHLYQYDIPNNDYIEFVMNLFKTTKIDGIECYYNNFTKDQIQLLISLAKENDKLICGGSGYHGRYRQGIELGVGIGDLNIPDDIINWVK